MGKLGCLLFLFQTDSSQWSDHMSTPTYIHVFWRKVAVGQFAKCATVFNQELC